VTRIPNMQGFLLLETDIPKLYIGQPPSDSKKTMLKNKKNGGRDVQL